MIKKYTKLFLFLSISLTVNAAHIIQIDEKQQEEKLERDKRNEEYFKNIVRSEIEQSTVIPKEVACLIEEFCDSKLDIPTFEKVNDASPYSYNNHLREIKEDVPASLCYCPDNRCCWFGWDSEYYAPWNIPRDSYDYIQNQHWNLQNGFKLANSLVFLFQKGNLTQEVLDCFYEKLGDFKPLVTLIILGYTYFKSKQEPPQVRNDINNNYIIINEVKIPITPFENNFQLDDLLKIKKFLLKRESLDQLAKHIILKSEFLRERKKNYTCCWLSFFLCCPCKICMNATKSCCNSCTAHTLIK